MRKPVNERVSEYRQRQKQNGMVQLSLIVPAGEADFFREMAALVRLKATDDDNPASAKPTELVVRGHQLTPIQIKLAESWAVRSGPKLRLSTSGLKLGELLARNIAHEIARAGWPVGENLGSEAQLLQHYKVSRSVLREAVRLLEYQSLATMRRGPSGGLIITRPSLQSASFAAGVYLDAQGFQAENLFATRKALALHVVERCLENWNDEAHEQLKQCLLYESTLDESASGSDLQRFHAVLAELSGDPALKLFTDITLQMARFHSSFYQRRSERSQAVAAVRQAHASITRALFAGDRDKALRAMTRHLVAAHKWTR